MPVRAIRGATTVDTDTPLEIQSATQEMLATLLERNALTPADIISAFFTVTDDLRSEFPARAARQLGWLDVPLLCTVEIPVVGALEHCIRVLLHVESIRLPREIRHSYLRGARRLRPDLDG